MAAWVRYTLGGVALIAWVILLGVSLAANYRFAQSWGHTDHEQMILGAGSIASDIFKGLAPLALLYFAQQKMRQALFFTASVWITTLLFSLVAATGFAATERYNAYHTAVQQQEATKALQEDIRKNRDDRAWLPTHKPLSVLNAEKAALEGNPLWPASAYCTAQRGPAHVAHCQKLRELDVQIAAAKEAEKRDAQIAASREKLVEKGRTYGDAQADFFQDFLGIKGSTTLIVSVILFVLLIEIGSGFGLTIALGLLAPPESKIGRIVSVLRPAKAPDMEAVATVSPLVRPAAVPAPPKAERPPRRANGSFKKPAAAKPESGGLKFSLFLRPGTEADIPRTSDKKVA